VTELERKILEHLESLPAWASLHELRGVVGGHSDSWLSSRHGSTIGGAVRSLESAGLVETRGGWEGGQFVVRRKAGS